MNAEHMLDAIGLLDDDLIQEAERYVRPRADYRRWGSLAASLALAVVLGYGALWLGTGGDVRKGLDWNGASGGTAENRPAASEPATGAPSGSMSPSDEMDSSLGGEEWPEPSPDSPNGAGPGEPGYAGVQGGEPCPAIMVDGVLYWSTGQAAAAPADGSAVRTVVSYTSGTPEMDGQTNFSQDLTARYAVTDRGLAVELDGEWILFDTTPPPAKS